MEEIKVGYFIRTDKGDIGKVKTATSTGIIIEDERHIHFDSITKHSPNIIDLIEVGDYVNGCEVVEKRNGMIYAGKCPDCYYYEIVTNYPKAIENIVTKEQYNSIKYVIGE